MRAGTANGAELEGLSIIASFVDDGKMFFAPNE
jgi:hypothetical protein